MSEQQQKDSSSSSAQEASASSSSSIGTSVLLLELKEKRDAAMRANQTLRSELFVSVDSEDGEFTQSKLRNFVDERPDEEKEDDEGDHVAHAKEIEAYQKMQVTEISQRRYQLLVGLLLEMQNGKSNYFQPWCNSSAFRPPTPETSLVHVVYSNPYAMTAATFEVVPSHDTLLSVLWAVRNFATDDFSTIAVKMAEMSSSDPDTIWLMNNCQHWTSYLTPEKRDKEKREQLEQECETEIARGMEECQDRFFQALTLMDHHMVGKTERHARRKAAREEVDKQIQDQRERRRLHYQIDSDTLSCSDDEEEEEEGGGELTSNYHETSDAQVRESVVHHCRDRMEEAWVRYQKDQAASSSSWFRSNGGVSRAVCIRHTLAPIFEHDAQEWCEKQSRLHSAKIQLESVRPQKHAEPEPRFGTVLLYDESATTFPQQLANVLTSWDQPLATFGFASSKAAAATVGSNQTSQTVPVMLIDWDERI